jgi:hypothetical protein
MYKLYEVTIGKQETVIDVPQQAQQTNPDGTVQHPAVAEQSHVQDIHRVRLENVVGQSVQEILEKTNPTLTEGEYVTSVTYLNNVDR